ncbi:MAG: preprotein translocase subunit SecE [Patescibacteria group bacterium]|nr:preprotein translocase subunit SecE [Patescibacteria group bacterium]
MNLIQYFKESLVELHRVTWPTRKQAIRSTAIILVFTMALAIFVALADFGFTEGIKAIIYNFF